MKEKILSALKTKYSNLGFGEKAFSGVADYLSTTITEEAQIETAISGVENLLKAFQGDIDRVRTEKSELQKQMDELKAKQDNGGNPDKKDEPKPDDLKAWLESTLAEKLTPIQTELQAYKQKEATTARQTIIAEKAKGLEIPDFLMKRLAIPDNLDEVGITNYLTEVKQELVDNSLPGINQYPQATEANAIQDLAGQLVDQYSKSEN